MESKAEARSWQGDRRENGKLSVKVESAAKLIVLCN
jgi:hypothetical protein